MTKMKKTTKPILLVLLMAFSSAVSAQDTAAPAQVDAEKAALIRQVLDMTRGLELGEEMAKTLASGRRQLYPHIDPAVFERLDAKLNCRELDDDIVAIYARHFSESELRDMIAFYRSPTGQRLIQRTPAIMRESAATAQAWAMDKVDELFRELDHGSGAEPMDPPPMDPPPIDPPGQP